MLAVGIGPFVKYLSSMCKALGSIPSSAQTGCGGADLSSFHLGNGGRRSEVEGHSWLCNRFRPI